MKKLLLSLAVFCIPFPARAFPIVGYVQVNPPNPPQQGGFNTSSGTVTGAFSLPYLTPGLCQTTDGTGKVINVSCGTGGVGGGGTIASAPQYEQPYYSQSGTTNTLSGASNLTFNPAIGENLGSGLPIFFYEPANTTPAFIENAGASGKQSLFIDSLDGIGINGLANSTVGGVYIIGDHFANFGRWSVQGSSANAALTYSGFTSTNNVSQSTLWVLPRKDGTSGQALTTDGSANLSFTTISGGGGGGGASGTITPSPQFQIPYYSLSGTTTTVTGVSGITTDGFGKINVSTVQIRNSDFVSNWGDNTNVFVGVSAAPTVKPGASNTCVGDATCATFTGATFSNTAVGHFAGQNMLTGNNNTCVGDQACGGLDTTGNGIKNTGVGANALSAIGTGQQNTATGWAAGSSITSGQNNDTYGFDAGNLISTGGGNDLFGSNTGPNVTTGINNACFGFNNCVNLATGSSNTVVGATAGQAGTAGTDSANTFIGYGSGLGGASGSVNNSIALGFNALVSASNTAQIGGTGNNAVRVIMSTFTVSSATITGPLNISSLSTGQCLQSGSGGLITTSGAPCGSGGGGGTSALQVTQSGVQITSPTASMNFNGTFFSLAGSGSTSTIAVSGSSVTLQAQNVIFLTSSLQNGSTFYVSSGTVNGQFSVNGTVDAESNVNIQNGGELFLQNSGNGSNVTLQNVGSGGTGILNVASSGMAILSSATVNTQLTAATYQGGGLATCGDGTHALSWGSGTFGCQTITTGGGGSGSGSVISSPFGQVAVYSLAGSSTQVTGNSNLLVNTSSITVAAPVTFTSPVQSTFTYGVTMGSANVSGAGNGAITLNIGLGTSAPAPFSVMSTSGSLQVGQFAVITSTNGTLASGGTGPVPGGPLGSVEVNVGGAHGGYNSFNYSGSSLTVASSASFTNDGLQNPTHGFVDIYEDFIPIGTPLLTIGSGNLHSQIQILDSQPANFNAFGITMGSLKVDPNNFTGDAIVDGPNDSQNQIQFWNTTGGVPGNMLIQTDAGAGNILLNPARVNEVTVSSFGVIISTSVNMSSDSIHFLKDPTSAQDAATKIYVDSAVINSISYKDAGRLATTAALPTNVYNNGSSGVGATLTGVALAALTVDGAAVVAGDRLLVKNEAAATNNGIYNVTVAGVNSAIAYVLTRASDFNQPVDITAGDALFITSGTANTNTGWVMISTGTITVGQSNIVFAQFSGNGSGVSAINASGNAAITGFATLIGGTNVTLSQSGSSITITASGSGGVSLTSTNTWTAEQIFQSSSSFTGGVYISSTIVLNGNSVGTNGQVLTSGGPGTVPTWTTVSGSGASLTSTNTWTAAQIFTSSVAVNNGLYSSPIIVSTVTVLSTNTVILASATLTSRVTVTLDASNAANKGQMLQITKVDGSTQPVIIVPNGTDLIFGTTRQYVLNSVSQTCGFIADGNGSWWSNGRCDATPSYIPMYPGAMVDTGLEHVSVSSDIVVCTINIPVPATITGWAYDTVATGGNISFGLMDTSGKIITVLNTVPIIGGTIVTTQTPKNVGPGNYLMAMSIDNVSSQLTGTSSQDRIAGCSRYANSGTGISNVTAGSGATVGPAFDIRMLVSGGLQTYNP